MSLWGVWGVMGSPLEPLGAFFGDPRGVIFGALGGHVGSFLVHLGSLGGSFGDFLLSWAVFSALWLKEPPYFNYARSILEA